MAEQRYQAVLAVISQGQTVKDVAAAMGVSRQTLQCRDRRCIRGFPRTKPPAWRFWPTGLIDLGSCPHQMPPMVEAVVLEMRRVHPTWGPKRIAYEIAKTDRAAAPSEYGVYRCLSSLGADRARSTPTPPPGLETVGARPGDGAVADGHHRRVGTDHRDR